MGKNILWNRTYCSSNFVFIDRPKIRPRIVFCYGFLKLYFAQGNMIEVVKSAFCKSIKNCMKHDSNMKCEYDIIGS